MSIASASPHYGQTFTNWRDQAATAWKKYVEHDFVNGLQAGTLPRSAFLHYLKQDYVFLVHFSRAWALAVVKSETLEEMKTAASTVDALVNHEMQLHVQICAEAGISEEMLFSTQEDPANMAYTRYVLDAGFSGDFLDLMAALAPCVMGYGEIGHRLKNHAGPDNPYRDWINTYADPGYQEMCHNVGAMIDAAVNRRMGERPQRLTRWKNLQQHFMAATELESGFWQMGLDAA